MVSVASTRNYPPLVQLQSTGAIECKRFLTCANYRVRW